MQEVVLLKTDAFSLRLRERDTVLAASNPEAGASTRSRQGSGLQRFQFLV